MSYVILQVIFNFNEGEVPEVHAEIAELLKIIVIVNCHCNRVLVSNKQISNMKECHVYI